MGLNPKTQPKGVTQMSKFILVTLTATGLALILASLTYISRDLGNGVLGCLAVGVLMAVGPYATHKYFGG